MNFYLSEYEERDHFYESNLSVNIKVKDKDTDLSALTS